MCVSEDEGGDGCELEGALPLLERRALAAAAPFSRQSSWQAHPHLGANPPGRQEGEEEAKSLARAEGVLRRHQGTWSYGGGEGCLGRERPRAGAGRSAPTSAEPTRPGKESRRRRHLTGTPPCLASGPP